MMSDREAELYLTLAIALKHAGLLDAELDAVEMVKQAQILVEKLEQVKLDIVLVREDVH
jgi:hypothetical protein